MWWLIGFWTGWFFFQIARVCLLLTQCHWLTSSCNQRLPAVLARPHLPLVLSVSSSWESERKCVFDKLIPRKEKNKHIFKYFLNIFFFNRLLFIVIHLRLGWILFYFCLNSTASVPLAFPWHLPPSTNICFGSTVPFPRPWKRSGNPLTEEEPSATTFFPLFLTVDGLTNQWGTNAFSRQNKIQKKRKGETLQT